jgi:hypothetical protein
MSHEMVAAAAAAAAAATAIKQKNEDAAAGATTDRLPCGVGICSKDDGMDRWDWCFELGRGGTCVDGVRWDSWSH